LITSQFSTTKYAEIVPQVGWHYLNLLFLPLLLCLMEGNSIPSDKNLSPGSQTPYLFLKFKTWDVQFLGPLRG